MGIFSIFIKPSGKTSIQNCTGLMCYFYLCKYFIFYHFCAKMPSSTPEPILSTTNQPEPSYSIPLSYRKMENLHIVFWLLKDISWCIILKPLGILMIFPTLIISIIIAWRTRGLMSELCHNLAITFWISANSYWMISEFFGFDEVIVWGEVTYKHLALIPFLAGMFMLLYFYLYWKPRNREVVETM
jgi:hypothetical protein